MEISIVGGPTSSGKSTFLKNPRAAEITGLPLATPIVLASTPQGLDRAAGARAVHFHYNLLRPLDLALANQLPQALTYATAFHIDPKWRDVILRPVPKQAVVLVVTKQTLLERATVRRHVEDDRDGVPTGDYPSAYMVSLIQRADIDALYEAWRRELERLAIPYVLVDSSDSQYRILQQPAPQPVRPVRPARGRTFVAAPA